ncbi:MAG: hypothetical protein LBS81_00485 [Endomicrobium sp.]|nr:hypothetical protein [Endomicrobium sp.]
MPIVLIVLSVCALSRVESFYRTYALATLPLQLLIAVASAVAFVYMYMLFLKGGFGQVKKIKLKQRI